MSVLATSPPDHADVVIVGAGPQGLAAALHLLGRAPSLHDGIAVLDPAGSWMAGWFERFARLRIEHLRSPGVHHPGPDPHGLAAWLGPEAESTGLPYGIPATAGFEDYCLHLARTAGLEAAVHGVAVRDLALRDDGIDLLVAGGSRVHAGHVVLAVDPGRRRIPAWVDSVLPSRPDRVTHSADVDLRSFGTDGLDGEHVAVVGGGLTAGHLAVGAAAAGAEVTLVARRPLQERMFDTDPGWLGPMNLRGYRALRDPAERVRAALRARDGGSVPPWMLRRLRSLRADGALRIADGVAVLAAAPRGQGVRLHLDGTEVDVDRLWLATGTRPDVTAHPLTRRLQDLAPTRIVEGWPVLEESSLRWPGTSAHLLGRLAMIPLGPAAGNLWGARVGADRVAEGVVAQQQRASAGLARGA